jgi:glutathione S-transferase
MISLWHHRLDPASRLVRLMLSEYGVAFDLEDVSPWEREPRFLEVNPAATLPVLFDGDGGAVVGPLAVIHHIERFYAPEAVAGLIPADAAGQAETWRLIEWVLGKLNDEVTRYVVEEKIGKRELRSGSPEPAVLRAAKHNLGEHLHYFAFLFATRTWLVGKEMTLADFALAAHFSCLDYLGDIDWTAAGEAKDWYARLKSRPAFRPLLTDRVSGMPATSTYADLDF